MRRRLVKSVVCICVLVCCAVSAQDATVSFDGTSTDIAGQTTTRTPGPWDADDAVWSTTDEVVPAIGSQASFKAAIAQAGSAQRRVGEAHTNGHVFVGGGSTNAEGAAGHAPSPWANIIGFDTTSFDDSFALSEISVTLRNRIGADTLDVRWFVEAGGKTYVSEVVAAGVGTTNTELTLADATAIEWFAFDNNANIEISSALGSSVGSPIFTDVDYVGIHEQLTYTTLGNWHGAFVPSFSATAIFYAANEARKPEPADGSTDVLWNAVLGWTPGESAVTHDVYWGTAFDDVNDADRNNPLDALVSQAQDANSYDPGRLAFGQTYFWRVDEVNGAPGNTVFKGDVWRFTVEPLSIPVEMITVTASSSNDAAMVPENTINGVGLNELDQHSTEVSEMWLSGMGDAAPSIQYEFDKAYKLHEMWVWNSNQLVEPVLGIGAKDVVIEHSLDGVEWVALGDAHQFAQAPGSATYTANTMVDFGGALARFVRITINAGWGMLPQYGLSAVRFMYIPTFAREPLPADEEATEAAHIVLSWRAGREAASHEVYLGTDAGDLSLVGATHENTFAAEGLDYDTTYYWRISEVNDAEDPAAYAGDVWRFSTPAFGVVDSFDQYNDDCQRIFFAWLDGLGHNGGEEIDGCAAAPYNGNGTGSIVGHATAPFGERSIVYAGSQSMPFSYDNAFGQSEATLTLPGQNWTTSGIKTLALAFYGTAGNTGQLYVRVNNTRLDYDGDPIDITRAQWHAWNIDLASVDGNLQHVTSLTIGVEGANAAGTVYIDEMRLYPLTSEVITPAMPDNANLKAHYPLDGDYQDVSGNKHHGTLVSPGEASIFEPGVMGQALTLTVAGQYVEITGYQGIVADRSDPDNPIQQPFTVACWINTTADGSIVTWGSSDGTPVGGQYQNFRIDGGSLRAEHGNGNYRGATPVTDGEWHHVALTVAEGANLRVPQNQLYVDGQADAFRAGGSDNVYNITADANVCIGQRASHGDRFLTGSIDDVRIYDRALSAAEIAALAGKTKLIHKPF